MNQHSEHLSTDKASFTTETKGDACIIELFGDWNHHGIEKVCLEFPKLSADGDHRRYSVDVQQISGFDTAGATMLHLFFKSAEARGAEFELKGAREDVSALLEEVRGNFPDPEKGEAKVEKVNLFHKYLTKIGMGCEALFSDIVMGLNILGATIWGSQLKPGRGSSASSAAIVNQMDLIGVRAVPIVVLMSICIGAIVAQQTAFQLRLFGAEVYAADLVSVLQLRELGVLITSIMIAGRSGSAITAEIGSMKMREEVDALTVMGLNPIGVLIFPRMIALLITLPLLTVVANLSALATSVAVLYFYSDVPPTIFIARMKDFIDYTTISSGMIKTPFMALIIGIVSAVEGLKVGGSAESLGRRVTASVVKSIFLVILVDGIFAIYYAAIDF